MVESYTTWCVLTTPDEISTAFRMEDEARIGFDCSGGTESRRSSDFVRRSDRGAGNRGHTDRKTVPAIDYVSAHLRKIRILIEFDKGTLLNLIS